MGENGGNDEKQNTHGSVYTPEARFTLVGRPFD